MVMVKRLRFNKMQNDIVSIENNLVNFEFYAIHVIREIPWSTQSGALVSKFDFLDLLEMSSEIGPHCSSNTFDIVPHLSYA